VCIHLIQRGEILDILGSFSLNFFFFTVPRVPRQDAVFSLICGRYDRYCSFVGSRHLPLGKGFPVIE